MPIDDYFSRDFITIFVLGKVNSEGSHVAQRLRQQCANIDGQAYLVSARKAILREACRLLDCRAVLLYHRR